MNSKIFLLTGLIILLLASCKSKNKTEDYILNENFDSNNLGWVEEFTQSHTTEIKDGALYITSLDTTKVQTSNHPLDMSFLLGLPEKYEITTSIQNIAHSDPAHYGITLVSASFTDKFEFSDSAIASVKEYDYNQGAETVLFSKEVNQNIESDTTPVYFKIDVADRDFKFFINDKLLTQGILKTKQWEDVRLFTTTGSAIKIDYLRIKKLE
ncbi:MAG TPA: hypothetical protein VK559_02845 [Ferruginibacter sp.]|nr:hypothetical protein [Ferruginibacter sp.]